MGERRSEWDVYVIRMDVERLDKISRIEDLQDVRKEDGATLSLINTDRIAHNKEEEVSQTSPNRLVSTLSSRLSLIVVVSASSRSIVYHL